MKIAILELYCGQSGKSGYYNSQELGLAKAYKHMGHKSYIVSPDNKVKQPDIKSLSEDIIFVHMPAKVVGVHSFFRLSCLKKWKIDLVHIDADNQIYAIPVMKYCQRNHIKFYNYVGTVSSDTSNVIKKFFTEFISSANIKMFRKSPTFVKTIAVQQSLAQRGVSSIVEPVGLDFEVIPTIKESKEKLREKLHLPMKKNILLFVGRLEEYKKPTEAIQLFSEIGTNYALVMIGDGSLKAQVLQMAGQLGLQDRVIHIAKIPNMEIHQYYKAADCFVNFNDKEIFGMSIMEAIYQGCPVVAKHAPGPDTIIQQGITGYLCGTLEEMRDKVKNMDVIIPECMRVQIQEKFSWNNTAKDILSRLDLNKNADRKEE